MYRYMINNDIYYITMFLEHNTTVATILLLPFMFIYFFDFFLFNTPAL